MQACSLVEQTPWNWLRRFEILRLQHFSVRFFNFPHTEREDWFNWGKKLIPEMTIWHFLTALIIGMFPSIWKRRKPRMVLRRRSCASIVFPIKIKEKESVRLRNPRSRITFPPNLIYPPSQSMQFQFPVKLHNLKSLGLIIAQFHGKISQILRYGILTEKWHILTGEIFSLRFGHFRFLVFHI